MAISTYKPPATNFTLEDRKRLCNEWAKSNLSRSEFIRQHRLPKSFHNWCYKLLPSEQFKEIENDVVNQDQWLQVVTQEELKVNCKANSSIPNAIGAELIQINLQCNNLKFNFKMPIGQVITFIKEINDATTVVR